jgi:transposase-like protein
VRVKGKWCYLYRGIDAAGDLVDVWLSETRDLEAAKAFFSRAKELTTDPPEKVVTDGLNSYPKAIREELGEEINHERVKCTENPIEQSHRGIKQRYYLTYSVLSVKIDTRSDRRTSIIVKRSRHNPSLERTMLEILVFR